MDKKKMLKEIEEDKELKLRSVLYDLERENFVTASWTLASLIEIKAVEDYIKKLED